MNSASPAVFTLRPSIGALLWPLAVPVAVFACTELYLSTGEVLYAHGASSMLLLLAALWGAAALVWELFAVPVCVFNLARSPGLRTRVNLLAVSAATIYIVVALCATIWFYGQLQHT